MDFFAVSLIINVKRAFKPSLALLALFLCASLAIGEYVQKSLAVSVSIGVLEDGADITEEIIAVMDSYSTLDVIRYDTLKPLLDDVSAGKIECGYTFVENAARHIENGSINRVSKVYVNPSTVASGFTNELMFAALTRVASPYIAANYLNGKVDKSYTELLNDAKPYVDSYFASDSPLKIETVVLKESAESAAGKPSNAVTKGVLSVFLFITFFYLTICGADEKTGGILERLTRRNLRIYCLSYVLAHALLILPVSTALYFTFTSAVFSIDSFIIIVIYFAVLSAISFAGTMCFKSARLLYAVFPLIAVLVIMLGGAFFDLGAVSQRLAFIQHLFPTYHFVVYMP